jgi:predicted Zn finger-like uncharacterized protein
MNLATRCTACGTVFRVTHEQLRASEGWARCGRCEAVFNAAEHLLEIPAHRDDLLDTAPGAHAAYAAPSRPSARQETQADDSDLAEIDEFEVQDMAQAPAAAAPRGPRQRVEPEMDRDDLPTPKGWQDPDDPDAPLQGALKPVSAAALHASTQAGQSPQSAAGARRIEPGFGGQQAGAHPQHRPDEPGAQPRPDATDGSEPVRGFKAWRERSGGAKAKAAANRPAFSRHGGPQGAWGHPAVVQALALLCAVLSLVLALQWAHHQRDSLAARWPATKDALKAWCSLVGCEISPPRVIDSLAVEGTSLALISPYSSAVKLSVELRNRSASAVAMPSVDLSLTDSNGAVVLRRALSPDDFNLADQTLAGGAVTTLNAAFKVNQLQYSGYHVEIFYP